MTGPEHYREAERRLLMAWEEDRQPGDVAHLVAEAQVHATLALTAATAMQAGVDGTEPGMGSGEFHEWYVAAGVKPPHLDDEDEEHRGCIEDAYSATELAEMDRDIEYRLDAEDDARNTAAYEADQRDNA